MMTNPDSAGALDDRLRMDALLPKGTVKWKAGVNKYDSFASIELVVELADAYEKHSEIGRLLNEAGIPIDEIKIWAFFGFKRAAYVGKTSDGGKYKIELFNFSYLRDGKQRLRLSARREHAFGHMYKLVDVIGKYVKLPNNEPLGQQENPDEKGRLL